MCKSAVISQIVQHRSSTRYSCAFLRRGGQLVKHKTPRQVNEPIKSCQQKKGKIGLSMRALRFIASLELQDLYLHRNYLSTKRLASSRNQAISFWQTILPPFLYLYIDFLRFSVFQGLSPSTGLHGRGLYILKNKSCRIFAKYHGHFKGNFIFEMR